MSDKLIKESINSYIKNSIPSMVENIMELRIPRGFMGKASIFAQEMGNRGLAAAEKFIIQQRMRSNDIDTRQAGHIRDIKMRQSGFDPNYVRDVQSNSPTSMPIHPGKKASNRQLDAHEAAVARFLERQNLERQLNRAKRLNPGLEKSFRDIANIRDNYTKRQQASSVNIDPTSKSSFIGRAERLARIRSKIV